MVQILPDLRRALFFPNMWVSLSPSFRLTLDEVSSARIRFSLRKKTQRLFSQADLLVDKYDTETRGGQVLGIL